MPTYEYECRSCGHSFEVFQNMSDEPIKTCPECGKEVRRLIFGGSGVIFKGSGFYVNDSKGKNSAAGKDTKAPSSPAAPPADTSSGGTAAKDAA
ncbi:MAG TPA: zinc ribbon domain-containing protein, partial [Spirochaetales bacterium]|nr:zinc ribbon domain-containing protein [Spirochaetales bacterium]